MLVSTVKWLTRSELSLRRVGESSPRLAEPDLGAGRVGHELQRAHAEPIQTVCVSPADDLLPIQVALQDAARPGGVFGTRQPEFKVGCRYRLPLVGGDDPVVGA